MTPLYFITLIKFAFLIFFEIPLRPNPAILGSNKKLIFASLQAPPFFEVLLATTFSLTLGTLFASPTSTVSASSVFKYSPSVDCVPICVLVVVIGGLDTLLWLGPATISYRLPTARFFVTRSGSYSESESDSLSLSQFGDFCRVCPHTFFEPFS